jgi:hypothetical protein
VAGRWANTRPADAARWLQGASVDWWFAGGWAIDLWLGRQTREHSDLEIGCFRSDLPSFAGVFSGWDVCIARNKQLQPHDLRDAPPDPPFSLWLKQPGSALWSFEILAEERLGERWLYRRDPRVERRADQLTIRRKGHRIVVPEVQLLYKAKDPRPKDAADFAAVAPTLAAGAKSWLRHALSVAHPNHPWIDAL